MSSRPFLLLIFAACLSFATLAHAGCANPNAAGGESPEGAVVYNAAYKTMQFCDGTTWWAMKNGGGLPSCPEGDTILMTSSGWGCGSGGSGDAGGCSEGGLAMGGYCWYFGESNQSCTAVCSSRGGYHEATRDYAGSGAGTDANCQALIDAFIGGLGGSVSATSCGFGAGFGCVFGGGAVRCTSPQTTANASSSGAHRICACQN